MKYKYKFYREPIDYLIIKLPEQIDMFYDIIGHITKDDEVKEDKHDEYEIFFNATTVLIRPEITSVSLSDILDEDSPPDQYIETDQFRELILIWKEKLPIRSIDNDTKH